MSNILIQDAVQALILERFDHASNLDAEPIPTTEAPNTNGHTIKSEPKPSTKRTTPSSGSAESDDEDISPPKKKRKTPKSEPLDNDAKLAKMLQEQENRTARATRVGANKKVVKKGPKKPRKKSEKKVKADDDSELDEVGSDGEVKEKLKKGGFHKLYHLSAPLAELVGEPTVCLVLFILELFLSLSTVPISVIPQRPQS